jgi:2-polyprenyl-3-methyl-5-hydroxy-6-metoxy-1,4-benzoquinol methylase
MNPDLPKNQIQHIEARYAKEYEYPAADIVRIARALSLIGAKQRVLDVGAFDGYISEQIAHANNDVVAFDGSQAALDIASSRGVATAKGDIAATWPFESGSFDVVFAGEIIEHLIDTDSFLKECRRMLVQSGRLIVTTPNLASLGRRLMLMFGKNPYIDTALRAEQAGHVRFFVTESLTLLLRENGFAVRRVLGDSVVFSGSGAGSPRLASLFPGLAKSIIVEAQVS